MKKAVLALIAVMLTAAATLINVVVDALESHGALYPKLTLYLALGCGALSLAAIIISVWGGSNGKKVPV